MKLDRLCTYRQSFVFENISRSNNFHFPNFLRGQIQKKKKRETKRTKIKPTSPGVKSSSISIPLSPPSPVNYREGNVWSLTIHLLPFLFSKLQSRLNYSSPRPRSNISDYKWWKPRVHRCESGKEKEKKRKKERKRINLSKESAGNSPFLSYFRDKLESILSNAST